MAAKTVEARVTGPPDRKKMRRVQLDVSQEDIELVREHADGTISSNQYPKGTPDHKQPTAWHEGQTLLALATRMQAAFRKARGA